MPSHSPEAHARRTKEYRESMIEIRKRLQREHGLSQDAAWILARGIMKAERKKRREARTI